MSFGKRANVFPGMAPLQEIFDFEIEQTEEKKSVQQVDWNTQKIVDGNAAESGAPMRNGKMVVTGKSIQLICVPLMIVAVSATDDVRDELRCVVRDHLSDKIKYFELDFQPLQK